LSTLEKAVVERAGGQQVSRPKSFAAAAIAGVAAAALTYRFLRSGNGAANAEGP
jgi:hypothetical protein